MLPGWLKHSENLPARVTQNPGSVLASGPPDQTQLCLRDSVSLPLGFPESAHGGSVAANTLAKWFKPRAQEDQPAHFQKMRPRSGCQDCSCGVLLSARGGRRGRDATCPECAWPGTDAVDVPSPPAPPTSSRTSTLSPESSVSPAKPSFPPAWQDRRTEEFACPHPRRLLPRDKRELARTYSSALGPPVGQRSSARRLPPPGGSGRTPPAVVPSALLCLTSPPPG